jgi:hypothetical protein
VVLSLLGLTALTTLSQRWSTLSWLAAVLVLVLVAIQMQLAAVVLAVFYQLLVML